MEENHSHNTGHVPSSFGIKVIRFSIFFIILCIGIPVYFLCREYQMTSTYASVWWLKPFNSEDLKWYSEEKQRNERKVYSKWATQQKGLASMYTSNFGKGAFCVTNVARHSYRHNQPINPPKFGADNKEQNLVDPIIWDASVGTCDLCI
jgi:hypothetical protein